MGTSSPPVPTLGITLRLDQETYTALERVTNNSRGKNKFVAALVRAELERRGELKPAGQKKRLDW